MARKKRVKNRAFPQEIRRAAVRMADTDGTVRSLGGNRDWARSPPAPPASPSGVPTPG